MPEITGQSLVRKLILGLQKDFLLVNRLGLLLHQCILGARTKVKVIVEVFSYD